MGETMSSTGTLNWMRALSAIEDWPYAETRAMSGTDEVVEVSPAMIVAGVRALSDESYSAPYEEIVDLIYTAMEYQRRREAASSTKEAR
jgi:hypothetical protein